LSLAGGVRRDQLPPLFDVNELAAIAMETPEVFWRSHALVRSLLTEGSLNGLRMTTSMVCSIRSVI